MGEEEGRGWSGYRLTPDCSKQLQANEIEGLMSYATNLLIISPLVCFRS